MAMLSNITPTYVRERLDYDPETGVFRWRSRSSFDNPKGWNSRYAGRHAGNIRNGYVVIVIDNARFYGHRLAWAHAYGEWPLGNIDHVDGNSTNNRITNLRLASQLQNTWNRGKCANNSSGQKGVSWHRRARKWQVYVNVNNKKFYLGLYETKEQAAAAYAEAARRYHGEFANLG